MRQELQAQRPCVDSRELEEIRYERGEPVDLHADRAVVPVDRRLVVYDAVFESLDHRADPSKRCAQIVRHPRHQLAPALLERSRLRSALGKPSYRCVELTGETR
jgi:hypothetical protein